MPHDKIKFSISKNKYYPVKPYTLLFLDAFYFPQVTYTKEDVVTAKEESHIGFANIRLAQGRANYDQHSIKYSHSLTLIGAVAIVGENTQQWRCCG